MGRAPHLGMPPLEPAPPLSRFEFWSPRWFYLPIWLWSLWLSLRHRSLMAPLVANPSFPAGGLVGESKGAILDMVGPEASPFFAPHVGVLRSAAPVAADVVNALAAMDSASLAFPIVAKPDLGCRGAGVRPLTNADDLARYLEEFPVGARLVLQELVDAEGEAGVFWVRLPGADQGRIISLTLKYFPYVVGDGRSTLEALIRADPRAGQLPHLYLPRHAARLDEVLPEGQPFRLAFAGSHSRGAIFRDGTHLVTPAMEARFAAIAAAIPEFWFGRFDVRFDVFTDLARGENFRIVEVNGAGAEATHIWDSRTTLVDAYRSLFRQWGLLWEVGARNLARGHRPEPLPAFLDRWKRERALTPAYPESW